VDEILAGTSARGRLSSVEIKSLIMIVGMPICWILGNWIPILNTTTVAVVGLAIMFLPGIDLLKWSDMQQGVPWDIILMVGGILCIGGVVTDTGGGAYIAELFLNSGVFTLPVMLALAGIVVLIYGLHTFLPVAPALATIFLPPLFTFAVVVGISPAVPLLLVAAIIAGNFILPLNPTITVSYAEGFYTFGDCAKAGILPALFYIALMSLWVPFIVGILGL
jgi:sodium-dependent dicarboxylate transporter 2/3/5